MMAFGNLPTEERADDQTVDLIALARSAFRDETAYIEQGFTVDPVGTADMLCRTLMDRAILGEVLATCRESNYPGDDRPSAISFWSQWYFGLMIPPLLILGSKGRCEISADPSSLWVRWTNTRQPEGFVLTRARALRLSRTDGDSDCCRALIDSHIEPMIRLLVDISGLSPKVFRMNVAVVIHYTARTLLAGQDPRLLDLTVAKRCADGSPNPLRDPYSARTARDGEARRRVCCLRYKLSGIDRCPGCPLKR